MNYWCFTGKTMVGQVSAYHVLWMLFQGSSSAARQLPYMENFVETWDGVCFSLLDYDFVVPVSELSEVLKVPPYTKLPGVQSWVKGVSNVRGRLLPSFNLADFFSGVLSKDEKYHRLLVVDNRQTYAGLLVDRVFGIHYFLTNTRRDKKIFALPKLLQGFVSGYFEYEGRNWNIFQLLKLIEDPRFSNVERN